MGQVAFNNMPGSIRAPLFYAEVNAGIPPYSGISRTLLIGRKLSSGFAVSAKPVNCGGTDPNALFGSGSMLADMLVEARWRNPTGEIWALPVADPSGGAAGTGTFTVTGTATSPGVLTRYVAGRRFDIPVAVGDTGAMVAANMATAFNRGYVARNRRMLLPVTAAALTNVATLTAVHTGTESANILLEAGLDGDEDEVPGITVAIAPMSGGTGVIDLAAALALLGSVAFEWIGSPYNTVSQLNAAQSFLSDGGTGRWSPTIGLNGHHITYNDGNLSAQTSFGSIRNDRHATLLGTFGYSTPPWVFVAALAGVIGFSKDMGRSLTEAIEIARPLQTISLDGLRGPGDATKRWALPDRESLYRNGISALTFSPDGTPVIDRVLTTYQTNLYGVPDITFLGIETMAISSYVKSYLKQIITSTYPRHVLRDDNPNGIQGVATVDQIRATIIHGYTQLCNIAGVVENVALFAKYLIVERSSDPNRVNAYLPIDVANQLVVFAANLTIFPQFDEATVALQ